MSRLRNTQRQIPGGFLWREPSTGFQIQGGFKSFQTICDAVLANRRANPHQCQQHGLSTDPAVISDEVNAFNAMVCERMGWNDYVMMPSASPPSPKFKALSPATEKEISAAAGKTKKIWQGVKSLNDWIESGEPAVAPELAEKRAAVCVACPLNGAGGLETWFTAPASTAIKKQFEKLESRKLATTLDEKLNICTSCFCPLKLLVQTPLKHKLAHMGAETRSALHPNCWILAEEIENAIKA
jgi:hypothetical protein